MARHGKCSSGVGHMIDFEECDAAWCGVSQCDVM